MKISHKTYPVLRMIEEGKLGKIGIQEIDLSFFENNKELVKEISDNFKSVYELYCSSVVCMTRPFQDAIFNSYSSLVRDEVWDNIGKKYGTILNMIYGGQSISVMYYIEGENNNEAHTCLVYYFLGDMLLGYRVQLTKDRRFFAWYSKTLVEYTDKFLRKNGINFTGINDLIKETDALLYSALVANINFIQYAHVETKVLDSGSKNQVINRKYKNESKTSVKILNSTWFTNLVKSEAFKVRGHFRLQPCGEGMKDRKLIWVNEFNKNGYTAPARKLKQYPVNLP